MNECQFKTFTDLFATFKTSTNVFTIQVCLFFINDDTRTKILLQFYATHVIVLCSASIYVAAPDHTCT